MYMAFVVTIQNREKELIDNDQISIIFNNLRNTKTEILNLGIVD